MTIRQGSDGTLGKFFFCKTSVQASCVCLYFHKHVHNINSKHGSRVHWDLYSYDLHVYFAVRIVSYKTVNLNPIICPILSVVLLVEYLLILN